MSSCRAAQPCPPLAHVSDEPAVRPEHAEHIHDLFRVRYELSRGATAPAEIARNLFFSRQRVYRALAELEYLGLVNSTPAPGKAGERGRRTYSAVRHTKPRKVA